VQSLVTCNCDGWREFQDRCEDLNTSEGAVHLMLTPAVFVDEFTPHAFRPDKKLTGVYFTLFNFPSNLLNSTRYRYPLAMLPSGFSINKLLKCAVYLPLRVLEKGHILHRPRSGPIRVAGSLYALLGIVNQLVIFILIQFNCRRPSGHRGCCWSHRS
jgi:hypothetical protein